MTSKTIEQWAIELSTGRGHTALEWANAMQRAVQRGTLAIFSLAIAPRVPMIESAEIDAWLTERNGEAEMDAPPLPANKAPKSFRQAPSPGTGHHSSRLTIGMRR